MYAWARGHAHTQTHTEFQFLFLCHLPSPSFVVLILSINSISAPFSSWWSFFLSKYIYELFAMFIVIVKRTFYVLVYPFSVSLLILTSLSFTFSLSIVLQEINISVETTGLAHTTCLSCPGTWLLSHSARRQRGTSDTIRSSLFSPATHPLPSYSFIAKSFH